MFTVKNKYFLIIESIRDLNLRNIKKFNKFIIIYRNNNIKEKIHDILKFRMSCKNKLIKFYVANDISLTVSTKADGIYLSAYNKNFKSLCLKRLNCEIIGSAHNTKEIELKRKQRCSSILFSKLFRVDYDKNSPFLGVIKFNKYFNLISNKLVPLGGIKENNLNSMKILNSKSCALFTEIKKKPAKIINRLF